MMLLPLQALLASQTGKSSSDSNDTGTQAAATSSPGTASEALGVEDGQMSSPPIGKDHQQSQDAAADTMGSGNGRSSQPETPDSSEQGKTFTAWLGGQTSTASPLLVDEVLPSVSRVSADLIGTSWVYS